MSTADAVRDLVAPLLAHRAVELDDVEFTGGVLRITVDRPGGIDLEALTEVSEAVSRLLDEHDPVPGRYTLEVSSPGLERLLKRPEHYQRSVGTKVKVKTRPHVDGERRREGVITAADDDGFELDGCRLGYADVERARTVFEWGGQPKPGTAGRPAGKQMQQAVEEGRS